MMFNGMHVFVDPNAATSSPRREHKAHPARLTYHVRIQKKWNKRFGMRLVPALFVVNSSAAFSLIPGGGIGGPDTLVIHPELWKKLVAATEHGKEGV